MEKVAIVTGGTRGIGLEISKRLIDDGYKVAAFYAGNDAAAKAFKDETGGMAVKVDVCDFEKCEAAAKKVAKELGAVTTLVNNAGITRDGMLHKMPEENWHDVIATNLTSCYNMCRAVMSGMRDQGYGRIINIR